MHKSSKCDIIKYVTPCLYHTLWWKGWCDIIKVRLYCGIVPSWHVAPLCILIYVSDPFHTVYPTCRRQRPTVLKKVECRRRRWPCTVAVQPFPKWIVDGIYYVQMKVRSRWMKSYSSWTVSAHSDWWNGESWSARQWHKGQLGGMLTTTDDRHSHGNWPAMDNFTKNQSLHSPGTAFS